MNQFSCKILFLLCLFWFELSFAQMKAGNAELTYQDSSINLTQNDSIKANNITLLRINNIKYDSSNVNVRTIDSVRIKAYLKDKDFKYFDDPEYTTTLWERLIDWLKRFFARLFSFDPKGVTGDVLQYLLIAFAVFAIFFVIYRKEIKGLFSKNKNIETIRSLEKLEDINSLDYDKLIEQAIENKNYRYAIRLNYLRTLKILSDKEFINWKPEKTNREYVNEIKYLNFKTGFINLTNDFETIWYGEYFINQSNYSLLIEKYSEFRSSLERNQK